MTVCVAVMCAETRLGGASTIFGASDRMLTSGDVQFQPPQRKLVDLTTSITAMVAGDMALQIEILHEIREFVQKTIDTNPKEWLTVKQIAAEYSRVYGEIRHQRATRDILAPLGLTRDSYLAKQKQMAPELVKQLASEILRYELPTADIIISGVDAVGPHIYVGRDGQMTCEDGVGFAAIGAGSQHAESLLMAARFVKTDSISRGVYLTYAAKKRAEIAPGVGADTDMFMIGPQLGSYSVLRDEVMNELEKIYQQNWKRLQEVSREAEIAAEEFVKRLAQAATEAAIAGASDQATIPADAGGDAITNPSAAGRKSIRPSKKSRKTRKS